MLRIRLHKTIAVSAILAAMILASACSQSGSAFPPSASQTPGNSDQGSNSAPTPTPAPSPGPGTAYKPVPLAWETASQPQRTQWSAYLQNIILNHWNTLLQGANDMGTFCPNFNNLNNDERANAWAALFVGVAKFESNYDNTSRYHESTMGIDGITDQPVYSEGLLQLSYQDVQGYSFCDFDWKVDSKLKGDDPKKTIFDPYKNLDCGVGIMSRQIARSGLITVSSNAYWSTLRSGGAYNKISQIAAIVKAMPFCTKK